jgi:hypothetical protein
VLVYILVAIVQLLEVQLAGPHGRLWVAQCPPTCWRASSFVQALRKWLHRFSSPGLLLYARCVSLCLQVGTRYTLLKQLGSGSFSSVVAALDNDTGEKVRQQRRHN